MATIQETNFDRIYQDGVYEAYFSEFENQDNRLPNYLKMFFTEDDTDREKEEVVDVPGGGTFEEWDGTNKYDSISEGNSKFFYPKDFQGGYKVKKRVLENIRAKQDKSSIAILKNKNFDLALRAARTLREHSCDIFENAFNDKYTGLDGLPLCYEEHPYVGSGSGVQANAGSLELSHDAIVTTKNAIRCFNDQNGNRINIFMPDVLIVAQELSSQADEIVLSMTKSTNANDVYNVNKNMIVVSIPYLSNPKRWFLGDLTFIKRYFKWLWKNRQEFESDYVMDNRVLKTSVFMSYAIGFTHWQGLYGHNPA